MITINPFYDYSKVETEAEFEEQLKSIKQMYNGGLTWQLFQFFLLKLKYHEDVFERLGNGFTLKKLEEYYNFELPRSEFNETHVSLFLNYILKYSKLIGNIADVYMVGYKPEVEEFRMIYLVYKIMEIEK